MRQIETLMQIPTSFNYETKQLKLECNAVCLLNTEGWQVTKQLGDDELAAMQQAVDNQLISLATVPFFNILTYSPKLFTDGDFLFIA